MSGDLFEKFEAFEIKAIDRIPEEDVLYCENQQKLYDQAIGFLQGCLQKTLEIYNAYQDDEFRKDGYIDKHDDIRHFEKRIENVRLAFINKIKYYFINKYKITIDKLSEKEGDLHYSDLVDEVIEQLGGLSFGEKAVKELQDKLKDSCRRGYSSEIKVNVKNKKVVINDFVWASKCKFMERWEISYSNRDTLILLFKGLTHFESGKIGLAHYYEWFMKEVGDYKESVFEKRELGYNKVQAIHIYKNGKTEIEFSTKEQAQKFAKEYCGYVGQGLVA